MRKKVKFIFLLILSIFSKLEKYSYSRRNVIIEEGLYQEFEFHLKKLFIFLKIFNSIFSKGPFK